MKATAVFAVLAAFGTGGIANASVIFTPGNHPASEENILFGAKETGIAITGTANTSGTPIVFSSSVDVLKQNAQGQADLLNNAGGNLTDVSVSAPGFTFDDFIVDLNKAKGSNITIAVTANDGVFNDTFTGKDGSNFITITTSGGERISSINFSSLDTGFLEFKQPRISGLTPIAVPEPATMALLGTGLVGLGLLGRKGKQG